jgi:hypothetical protein
LIFFCTIILSLDLFCVVLLVVGCNLPKACKNQHNLWVQRGGRTYKRWNWYDWEKITNCRKAIGSPIKLYILSFRLPAQVWKICFTQSASDNSRRFVIFNWINQPDASVSQVYYLSFNL